jgi:hypothetical protein
LWTLFKIALAAMVVCSRQPPHHTVTESCTDKRQFACLHRTAAHQPTRHRAAHFITKAKSSGVTAKTEATETRIPPPPPSSNTQIEPKSSVAAADLEPTMGLNSESRTIQEQVAAATGVAERMTVAALAPARDDAEPIGGKSPNKRDLLVAVVMARPEIKSVPDLAGQRVAMDERHLASSGKVFVALALAGAASVEVSARHTEAIERLSNGEVNAAVLALVSADAAESFPEIAGFKIFRVPLCPPCFRARP